MRAIQILADTIYFTLAILFLPFIVFSVLRKEKYRKYFSERFGNVKRRKTSRQKKCIWIHAVSVGETIAAAPLIAELKQQIPDCVIVLSATTKTGREVAAKKFPKIYSFQFPLDFSFCVKRAFSRLKPDLIILMELELWPNFIAEANIRKIPVVVANSRITEKSYRGYKKAKLLKFLFSDLSLVLTQNETYAKRFRDLGARNVLITGTLKYDNVKLEPAQQARTKYRRLLRIAPSQHVLIAGSAHPPEHIVAAKAHKILLAKGLSVRLILVPRHPEKYEQIKSDLRNLGCKFELRSEISESAGESAVITFIDTMGELAALYAVSEVAFIGGSLIPHGGQNIIEPAGLGAVPVFGKYIFNFAEPARELLEADAAIMLKNSVQNNAIMDTENLIDEAAKELAEVCLELFTNDEKFKRMRKNAINTVERGKGAANRSAEQIRKLLFESET